MIKIPDSASRTSTQNQAYDQTDPNKTFGGASINPTPRQVLPNIGAIQWEGDKAMNNAFMQVASDLGNIALQMKEKADQEKMVVAQTQAQTNILKMKNNILQMRKVVDNEAEVNGWSSDQREQEYLHRRDNIVEAFKAREISHPKIKQHYDAGMTVFTEQDNLDFMEHMGKVRHNELKTTIVKEMQLRMELVTNTNDANTAVNEINKQLISIDKHGAASVDMTDEMVKASKTETVNKMVEGFLSNQLMNYDYDTAIDAMKTFGEMYPELDKTAIKKTLKALNEEKIQKQEQEQRKYDANWMGTFDLSLETGKDIKKDEEILNDPRLSDIKKAEALGKLKKYKEDTTKAYEESTYVEQMRLTDPSHFVGDNSDKTVRSVDNWFKQKVLDYEELLQKNPIAGYVQLAKETAQVGKMSSQFRGEITKLVKSDNPESVKIGVAILKTLQHESPEMIEKDFSKHEDVLIVAELVNAGHDPIESKQIAKKYVTMEKSKRDDLIKDAKTLVTDDDYSELVDAYDDWGMDEEITPAMKSEYKDVFSKYYVATDGNREIASRRALASVTHKWNKVTLDGTGRFMKNGPEQIYGSGDNEWMKEQFEKDLLEFNKEPDEVMIVPNPVTQFTNSPDYLLVDKDSGMYLTNAPWKPSKTKYNEDKLEALRQAEPENIRRAELKKQALSPQGR